jgi:hypothetical protein
LRASLLFQAKLIVDGLRDFVLVPVSLVATLAGLVRGGDEPEREFESVLDLGRQTERWINLFGTHEPFEAGGQAGNLDQLVTRAEELLREQARQGGVSDNAAAALENALAALHRRARDAAAISAEAPPEKD